MLILRQALMLLYTVSCAAEDWRSREISPGVSLGFGICGMVLQGMSVTGVPADMSRTEDFLRLAAAFGPGILCLLLSRLSGGGIGTGDGVYLLVAGWYLPFQKILCMLLISGMLVVVIALCILTFGGRKRRNSGKTELPYLTLMLPSYILTWVICR